MGGVGWGAAITLMFTLIHRIDMDRLYYDFFSCPAHTHTPLVATLSYLLLHFHNDRMFLDDIFLHLHNLTHTHIVDSR